VIKVRLICFGVLKEWLGEAESTVELPEGATVAKLLEHLSAHKPSPHKRGIAVSVNAEFASATQILRDGDEVGLLPPVSGGSSNASDGQRDANAKPADMEPEGTTALTHEPIDIAKIIAHAKQSEDGAVVIFDGIVRNQTRGRQTLYLDYEAYDEMARRQMDQLARDARSRFAVRHATIVHRLGRLQVGESSVLIVVASAHRAQAYEASRWLIDTLKKTVPIWKKETFVDGAVWADGDPFPEGIAVE
jgi:molybdopterin synthase catalytic subunit/molybdopterin converting factor small subunit